MVADERELVTWCQREIEQLRRELAGLLREPEVERELPAHWVVHEQQLDWHVFIAEEILEPDIDVEILPGGLVVRARLPRQERLLVGVLPVPSGYDVQHPLVRYQIGSLHVRVLRRTGGRP